MLKKILKWAGITILFLVLGLSVTVAFRQNLTYDAPLPDIKVGKDSLLLARGRYLIYGPAHCADCHASPEKSDLVNKGQEAELSGGMLVKN